MVDWILFGKVSMFPPYLIGLLTGIASGAAMLPYTVIKEANPSQYGGTATGVVNFLNFTFGAILVPVFARILIRISGEASVMQPEHYQKAFMPLLLGVATAILLTFMLRETVPSGRKSRS